MKWKEWVQFKFDCINKFNDFIFNRVVDIRAENQARDDYVKELELRLEMLEKCVALLQLDEIDRLVND